MCTFSTHCSNDDNNEEKITCTAHTKVGEKERDDERMKTSNTLLYESTNRVVIVQLSHCILPEPISHKTRRKANEEERKNKK